ncbi:MAG: UDP-galactopyranose mutase [Firmicutes bacterium]|nr:UDP-galactopyranose mutase [Bacillota bacterium]
MFDYLIVGAGFAGCVLAERIATQLNKKVLIVERRNHIGGNAYDYYDNNGVLVHKYGPHIFHTNYKKVFDFLSQFTDWRIYEHRVLASVDGMKVPIPINMNTLNQLYGLNLSGSTDVEHFYDSVRVNIENPLNAEEMVISKVGKELYEKFFKGYTIKQWDIDPRELAASVTARIPTRMNKDDRYFTDKYQAIPKHGYTAMFINMINHPNISVLLQTDYKNIIRKLSFDKVIYTGPIDEFFDGVHGVLPYRSLNFVYEYFEQEQFQQTAQINYPNEYDFTRITEYKHITGQECKGTTIAYEYSISAGPQQEKYYPIPAEQTEILYNLYKNEAEKVGNTIFCGRLAEYKYYNMDQVVNKALEVFKTRIAK